MLALPYVASASSCPSLNRNLSVGSRGADVLQLQKFLITQNLLAPDSSTGYFGRLTESAVKKFQCNRGLVCSGSVWTNGYGAVGPKTRAAIANACATIQTSIAPNSGSGAVSTSVNSATTPDPTAPNTPAVVLTQPAPPTTSPVASTTPQPTVALRTQIAAAGSELAQARQFQSLVTEAPVMKEFFVDAYAKDTGDGSTFSPFRTIARARDAARAYRANMTGNIVISIRGDGREYFMDQPLALGASDSGTNGYFIVYRGVGTAPRITGAVTLAPSASAWSVAVSGYQFYQRALPADVSGGAVRNIYVNDMRAVRARTPDLSETCHLSATSTSATGATTFECDASLIPPSYTTNAGLEAVGYREWHTFRCPATVTSTANSTSIRLSDNCSYLSSSANLGASFSFNSLKWLENSIVFLDQPDEWHIRDGMLFYYPRSGISIGTLTASIPVQEKLFALDGASNVAFDNMTFAYTNWAGPNESFGYVDFQAGHPYMYGSGSWVVGSVPAAVTCSNCRSVSFTNNTFAHLGGNGLAFIDGSSDNAAYNNSLTDISGTGVYVGSIDGAQDGLNQNRSTWHNLIEKNRISNVGKEFFGSLGIFVGYAGYTNILGNVISNLPYSGISVGWGWSNQSVRNLRANTIASNIVTDTMQMLTDGGAIYINSNQRGASDNSQRTTINQNNIIGIGNATPGHFSAGIYLDNGASFVSLMGNTISGLAPGGTATFFSPGSAGVPGASDYISQ